MSNDAIRAEWLEQFGNFSPKIICVGLNYEEHAGELGARAPTAPLLFGKFANTLCAHEDPIVLPVGIGHVDAEAELAIVIGRHADHIARRDALGAVAGYTCANDVSARDAQFGDGQWFRGKGYDSFCPVGPVLVAADQLDPDDLLVEQRVNGELLQSARTNLLVFDVPTLVSYVSSVLTLERGDVILTGTPPGVGFSREPKHSLKDGDVVEVLVEGVGVLRNPVRATVIEPDDQPWEL